MHTTITRLAVAAAVAAVLLVSSSVGAQAPITPPAGFPAVGGTPIVTLLSPGAAPRTALRYTFKAGDKPQMVMTMAMTTDMNIGGKSLMAMALPIMKITAAMNINSVAANGDATYDVTFTDMTAEAPPGGDPNMAAMIQKTAGSIIGMKGTATVTNRGFTTAAKFSADAANPALDQTLSQMSSSLESMSAPLPAEPVGVGARWEIRQSLNSNGTVVFQRSECELVSIDGPVVKLNVKLEQTGPPQSMSGAGMPPGMTMNVERLSGAGAGTMLIRLDGIVSASELTSATSIEMTMDMGGMKQKANMDMKLNLSTAPAPAK